MMEDLYSCASNDDVQVLFFLDPMHQIHNNENDYAWKPKRLVGTKQVLANMKGDDIFFCGEVTDIDASTCQYGKETTDYYWCNKSGIATAHDTANRR